MPRRLGAKPTSAETSLLAQPGSGLCDTYARWVKISLPLPCSNCGVRDPVSVQIDANWYEWDCPKCGASNQILSSLDWTKGRSHQRARDPVPRAGRLLHVHRFFRDALEAELARLYFKWRGIDAGLAAVRDGTHPPSAGPIPKPSDEELEEELRRLGSIDEKIEAVSLLLDPRGIDKFAKQSDLGDRIDNDYPSLNIGSLAKDIQRAVFWRRNRVVHAGYTDHDEGDARTAQNCANIGILLLKHMDVERRRSIDGG